MFDRNPSAPGAAIADRFYSISTHDVEGILSKCHQLGKKESLAGIITYSSDTMPLKAVASVSDAFCLHSFSMQTVENTTNKAQMKKKIFEAQIPTPEWLVTKEWEDTLSFLKRSGPIIVKPAAGSMGSAGVSRVDDKKNLQTAFEIASKASENGLIILEKFYKGREFNIGGIVSNNKATVITISEKLNLGMAQNFIVSGFRTGRNFNMNFKYSIDEIVEPVLLAVKALGINDSFFGADVLLTNQGPLILEIGLLLDAKIDRLLFFAGVDVYSMRCKVAIGDEMSFQPLDKSKAYALQFIFASQKGRLAIKNRQVSKSTDINEGRISIEWERQEGDMVNPPKSVADILGWVMVEAADREITSRYAEKTVKSKLFNIVCSGEKENDTV
jgi:biotin carboxylase